MSNASNPRRREGLPHPRGATWDGEGVNFSLFPANATKVELCLLDADGGRNRARADRVAGIYGPILPRLDRRHRSRPSLWIPRARALRPQHGHRFNPNKLVMLKACSQDPLLNSVKLFAEPWDCGLGGYQVGGFPPGWAEWNDRYRDTARDFWKGDASASSMAPRLSASPDTFDQQGRRPWACVNFITAHDGLIPPPNLRLFFACGRVCFLPIPDGQSNFDQATGSLESVGVYRLILRPSHDGNAQLRRGAKADYGIASGRRSAPLFRFRLG